MKELSDIIKAYSEACLHKKQAALATVVYVDGSSYRRPGARMLITEDGQLTGAISGGCLEGDALRKALLVMTQNKPMLVTYDTTDEDDAKLGIGLGCNGIIQVLIEPLDPQSDKNPLQLLKQVINERKKFVITTLFSLSDKKNPQQGTVCCLSDDKVIYGNASAASLKETLLQDAKQVLSDENASFKKYITESGTVEVFYEMVPPVISLIIIGAGNDVMPLVSMAQIMGWEITIVDGRANYATQARFPSVKKIIVTKPEKVLQQITIDEQTVFLLMTHNYNYDFAMLRNLLQHKPRYIGMLGPRKKMEKMMDELKEEGNPVTNEQLEVVFAPVGLDIGAETSEEIALSVLSEIKAVLSGRAGNSLRNYTTAIHARSSTRIEEVRLPSKS